MSMSERSCSGPAGEDMSIAAAFALAWTPRSISANGESQEETAMYS
jgi:hypothetical protein